MRSPSAVILRRWLPRIAVVAVACWVVRLVREVFLTTNLTVAGDGQVAIRYWEVARTSFARGHGFPLWDRSQCAGYPFLGNPETALGSSFVAGVFGIHGDVMERWYPTLFSVVAMLGVYAWGRRVLLLARLPALFAGAIWVASGFVSTHFTGHMTFVPFALIPWLLLLARLGEDDLRAAAGVGVLLALMAIEGGTYPVPYAIVALAIAVIPRLFTPGGALKIGRLALISAVVLFLLAGIKLYPELAQLARHPRHFDERDSLTWSEFFPIFGEKDHLGGFGTHPYVWDEYRAFVGPLALGMGIAGMGASIILKPRRWDLFLLILVTLFLARGHYSESAPYVELTKLPVFAQLRVPSRYVVLTALGVAGAAGVALDVAIKQAGKRRLLVAFFLAIAAVAVYDPIVAANHVLKAACTQPWLPRPDPDPPVSPYQVVYGSDYNRVAEYPARNFGAVTCYKPWEYPEGSGYLMDARPQAFVDGPDVGSVQRVEVLQNGYDFDVTMARAGSVHVIQNFDPDWRSDVGAAARSQNGTLDVRLPAGTHHVKLRYKPAGLMMGALTSIAGVLLVLAIFALHVLLDRRKKQRALHDDEVAPAAKAPSALAA